LRTPPPCSTPSSAVSSSRCICNSAQFCTLGKQRLGCEIRSNPSYRSPSLIPRTNCTRFAGNPIRLISPSFPLPDISPIVWRARGFIVRKHNMGAKVLEKRANTIAKYGTRNARRGEVSQIVSPFHEQHAHSFPSSVVARRAAEVLLHCIFHSFITSFIHL